MDRQQGYEPTATIMRSSSIALLQERFRQLERAREMRQQREFFRFFAEAEQVKPAATIAVYEPSSKQPLISSNKLLQDSPSSSLYLQPTIMQGLYNFDLQVKQIPELRSSNLLMIQTQPSYFDESDVDTSLHL